MGTRYLLIVASGDHVQEQHSYSYTTSLSFRSCSTPLKLEAPQWPHRNSAYVASYESHSRIMPPMPAFEPERTNGRSVNSLKRKGLGSLGTSLILYFWKIITGPLSPLVEACRRTGRNQKDCLIITWTRSVIKDHEPLHFWLSHGTCQSNWLTALESPHEQVYASVRSSRWWWTTWCNAYS